MKKYAHIYISLILLIVGVFFIVQAVLPDKSVYKNPDTKVDIYEWQTAMASVINQSIIVANIDTKQLKSVTDGIYMSDTLSLMIPLKKVRDTFDCAVNEYKEGYILVEKGNSVLKLYKNTKLCELDGETKETVTAIDDINGVTYIPVDILCSTFNYSYNFDMEVNQASIMNIDVDARTIPYKYNYEEKGRISAPSNQGNLGTCWAFSSLTALETSLMPEEDYSFSVDHMSINNSYNLNQYYGGDYIMSLAYLLAWQGPVLEEEDPYGDGVSPDNLLASKHLQEVQIIESKDFETIKKMVFKYGGVQSSFYASSLSSKSGNTKYYNAQTNSYCYLGAEKPNHDIVIIGWDDNYPKENFNVDIEGNGAFICRNSWGADFGENGDFYISYYDTNIGVHNVVYTNIEPNDNYKNIYQTDLCGYIGQLGYGEETAYFANAYTTTADELIKAVGFYATGVDTEYSIYVCENFSDMNSLSKRSDPVVTGTLKNSGFYTIKLDNPVPIPAGQKFAVIVRITTPNTDRPVAVEYAHDERTRAVDISDGEGYVSLRGITWESAEEKNNCNICLKVYTDIGK